MYKNIMLALDWNNKISESLIEEVINLTRGQITNVRIIHVIDESFVNYGGPPFDYVSIIASWREDGEKLLNDAATKIASQSPAKVDTLILELKPLQGRVAEVIVEAAKEWPADLLVVGTHGRRGFSRLFLGSVAENIVRIAPTPVLLVRGTDG
ncbi:universal stress protein [Legionella longbeachae]|nr:universal stress protein [Legionella longbeachae]HBD7399290.1 universal stress protein [Legionella pneumophila]ARB92643.1 universal stress protein [Legionella longbeachae]ARM34182.1 universal stress protein [Legionella longbeachae]EEZ96562.1 universal stress family protein [Legionella longbeachae D-4968]QEY50000.1 universal stress protein [Legionella longbeachae]